MWCGWGGGRPQVAYNEGVVIVRCPGCDNLHLIADRLDWFQEGNVDVHDLIQRYGEEDGGAAGAVSVQLSPEDLRVLEREAKAKAAQEAEPK